MNKKTAELSIWIDDFDDIYSDFDFRHFSKRRISEDLLHELEVAFASRAAPPTLLVLLLPAAKRNAAIERNIAISLHSFFEEQQQRQEAKYRTTFKKGIRLLLTGALVMAGNFLLSSRFGQSVLFLMLRLLLEPCSWFLIWIGLEKLYYEVGEIKKERVRFQHLSQMKIHFQSSE